MEMLRELLNPVIDEHTVSQITNEHFEEAVKDLTDKQKKDLKTILYHAHAEGFTDGFKYAMKLSKELDG